jgi:hypothetical protein
VGLEAPAAAVRHAVRQCPRGTTVVRSFNFNRANYSERAINVEINHLIEAAEPPSLNYRQYLGASFIGSECLRKVQYDWMCDPQHPVRTEDIFSRGHHFEARMRAHLIAAGFVFAPKHQLGFIELDGIFRGNADGIIISGPLVSLAYPCLWECKCLNAKGWRAVERDGLKGIYEVYADQVALYQAYLDCTNSALFSVLNADTCERLFFLVPFDAQRAQLISDRAVAVIEATRAGELLPRISEDPNDWRCKACGWHQKCWSMS